MEYEYNIQTCKLFKDMEKYQKELCHEYVGTEHLVLAILNRDDEFNKTLNKFNLFYDAFYNEVKKTLKHSDKRHIGFYTPLLKKIINECENNITYKELFIKMLEEGEGVAIRLMFSLDIDVDNLYNYLTKSKNKNLDIYKYGKSFNEYINLNEKVVGRDKELNLITQTLMRKKKCNPLLIGQAGVGKSAIVEELTRKIVNGSVCGTLLDKEIVCLEMGSLISGTRYRGEFEERLMRIIEEIKDDQNIILFIDEMHTISGAGAAEGAISASDILKPYLARGDIKCIGATTKEEYEKYICKDKALMRRFEPIFIEEPSEDETINILKNIKDEYESYHKVKISDENIQILVKLANTYFPNKKNPDKALELLDSVMSYVKLKESFSLIEKKEQELKIIKMNKYKELEKGNFKEALKNNVLENKLEKNIKILRSGVKSKVKKDDIINVLETKNNLLINKIKVSKNNKYYSLIKEINNHKNFINVNLETIDFDELKKITNYEYFKLNENNFDKLIAKIKYHPSLLIAISDDFKTKVFIEKIKKNHYYEYNNEIISFKNAVFLIDKDKSSIGFVTS